MSDVSRLSSLATESSALARRDRGRRVLRCLPLALVVGLTVFLALRADPSLRDVSQVPRPMVRLLDSSDFLKNVLGFAVLAGTVHFAFAGTTRQPWSRLARRAAGAALLVVGLEIAQLMLPQRSCDWRDIVAGWLGIGLASLPWLRLAK